MGPLSPEGQHQKGRYICTESSEPSESHLGSQQEAHKGSGSEAGGAFIQNIFLAATYVKGTEKTAQGSRVAGTNTCKVLLYGGTHAHV